MANKRAPFRTPRLFSFIFREEQSVQHLMINTRGEKTETDHITLSHNVRSSGLSPQITQKQSTFLKKKVCKFSNSYPKLHCLALKYKGMIACVFIANLKVFGTLSIKIYLMIFTFLKTPHFSLHILIVLTSTEAYTNIKP